MMVDDMLPHTSLSPEASTWLSNLEVEESRHINFAQMASERSQYLEACLDASNRAIERYGLELSEVDMGGVSCTRVVSGSGTSNGRLFYVFGGAFMFGDPRSDLPIIGALADLCGVEVIAPHYRLAPEHCAPAAFDDCLAAYRAATITEEGPLLLAGESAGGNLALLIAQHAVFEGFDLPRAIALLSPAVDLRVDQQLFTPVYGLDPTLDPKRMIDVLDAYAHGTDPRDPSISPLFGSMEGLPPTIITTGTCDQLVNMCLRLHRKMRQTGVEVECNVWDGLWHVFEFYDEYPEAFESLAEIAAFLNKR